MRTIVVGDVHGCLYELYDLIEAVGGLLKEDKWVFVGDLIHKGPYSKEVVRAVMSIPDVVVVEGNHEEKHKRWWKKEESRFMSGTPNNMQHVEEYPDLLGRGEIDLLSNCKLWYKPCPEIIVIHGGIPDSITSLPDDIDFSLMNSKAKRHYNQLLRTRYVNSNGKMVALGHETEDDDYWAHTYDGRFGFAIFGHQPFETPYWFENALGIDTGCVHGNKLSAAIIENNQVTDIISVDARENYKPMVYIAQQRPSGTLERE